MKNQIILITSLFVILSSCQKNDITEEEKSIKNTINAFVKAADDRNVRSLDILLHNEFRVLANRLFSSDSLTTINKTAYLTLIETGKIGGDKRQIKIEEVRIEGNNSFVIASFLGKSMIIHSKLFLIKNVSGNWQLVSDFPNVEQVEQ